MRKLLAFDTSTEACTVGLRWSGQDTFRHRIAPKAHGDLILPMIDSLLAEASAQLRDLDGIVVGRGPGGFTGVRIAMSVAQGLALGADVPVVPVSTLAAMAQGAFRERGVQRVLCALDARMGEVYYGGYIIENGEARCVLAEAVTNPAAVRRPEGAGWFGCGLGFRTYAAELRSALGGAIDEMGPERYPHALDLLTLGVANLARGESVPPEDAIPVYLRDKVVDVPARFEPNAPA